MRREIDRFLFFFVLSFGQTSQNNFIIEGLVCAFQWKEQRPKKIWGTWVTALIFNGMQQMEFIIDF